MNNHTFTPGDVLTDKRDREAPGEVGPPMYVFVGHDEYGDAVVETADGDLESVNYGFLAKVKL